MPAGQDQLIERRRLHFEQTVTLACGLLILWLCPLWVVTVRTVGLLLDKACVGMIGEVKGGTQNGRDQLIVKMQLYLSTQLVTVTVGHVRLRGTQRCVCFVCLYVLVNMCKDKGPLITNEQQ